LDVYPFGDGLVSQRNISGYYFSSYYEMKENELYLEAAAGSASSSANGDQSGHTAGDTSGIGAGMNVANLSLMLPEDLSAEGDERQHWVTAIQQHINYYTIDFTGNPSLSL
jgi:hypothetical protein